MVPMSRLFLRLGFCWALLLLPVESIAAERSPIFGQASVEPMSQAASRDITARGALANHYGSAAVTHAYVAYIYAFYARNYAVSNSATEQSWYMTASNNAYYAYIYAYYASIYSASGN
jgi:lipocalin